jgi:hypothetical protein
VGQSHGPVGVGGGWGATGEQHAQAHAGEQGRARGHIEPDRARRRAGQGPTDPGAQGNGVRQHDRTDQPGTGRSEHRAARVHAAKHGHHPEVERQRPNRRRALAHGGGAQQSGGELFSPDDDGVGHRQVHGQPAPVADPVAEGQRHPTGRQVGDDESRHQQVASSPPAPPGPLHRRSLALVARQCHQPTGRAAGPSASQRPGDSR